MVWIEGGTFAMGSDHHYAEERPAHAVAVAGFLIDVTPVTNGQFRAFVEATGHVTLAEVAPDPRDYPGAPASMLKAGSLVFSPPGHPVDLRDWRQWWSFRVRANWRKPHGPGSSIRGMDDHPVVHVAYRDAEAFAVWAGKALPTEAEWEFAARGGLDGAEYAWGSDFEPQGRPMAKTWRGEFPFQNLAADGFEGTAPVGSFPANGYGLHDMIGNVWEWTADPWAAHHAPGAPQACCVPSDPRGGRGAAGREPSARAMPRKVLKGGSHLCAPNYCRRYRPAARHAETVDTSTGHIGFRCVRRPPLRPGDPPSSA